MLSPQAAITSGERGSANPLRGRWENQELAEQIRQIHQESRRTYGSPRIQASLRQLGRRHGRNRIGRLMREQQICGRQKCRYRVLTTDSKHDQPIAPNRLAELPKPSGTNQVWLADITYIQTAQGWLYLAAILDLYSRKIVGRASSEHIDTTLVLAAWNRALRHPEPPARLVFKSKSSTTDKGSTALWAINHPVNLKVPTTDEILETQT